MNEGNTETWSESEITAKNRRLFILEKDGQRRASLLFRLSNVRGISDSGQKGVVYRELWPTGLEGPVNFDSDAELTDALKEHGLPVFERLETVRRSVAAAMLG